MLSESDNACCDGVSVIYDHPTDTEDGVERRRITYSVREFPGTEEVSYKLLDSDTARYRLYKKIDVLGRDGTILPTEESGAEQVLADFVEDLQLVNIEDSSRLYSGSDGSGSIRIYDTVTKKGVAGGGIDSPPISTLAFGPDGLLYSGFHPRSMIWIYDPVAKKELGAFPTRLPISALAFGPDGLLYSGHNKIAGISVYDPVSKKRVGIVGSGPISTLAFRPDGLLYYADRDDRRTPIRIIDPVINKWVGDFRSIDVGRPVSVLAFDNKRTGKESLVNIKLTFRSKNKQHTADQTYTKEVDEEHHIGNYNFEFNDKYKRDVFFSTVAVRNMLL